MFRALLIGVDFYFPNRLPNGGCYASLHGCVADARRVEDLLRARVEGPVEITTLHAAHDSSDPTKPAGDRASWPTAKNIVAKLEALVAASAPGDQVFVHYSGHGGRVVTKYPSLKTAKGIDEALVPVDIGGDDPSKLTLLADRYVRDVYLARYLHALSLKGAVVTLVFDSCHSGGATRTIESNDAVRTAIGGTTNLDTSEGTEDPEELAAQVRAVWNQLTHEESARREATGATRDAGASLTWVPDAGRYVLLAACRETESALETTLDDGTRGGVLTDAFLRAVGTPSDSYTWQTVFDRVSARVRARYPQQTPMLFGERGRHVLGVRMTDVTPTVTVTRIDGAGGRVALSAGRATGIVKGARFEIHTLGTTDFSRDASIVATAVVASTGAVESWATIESGDLTKVVQGAPALLLSVPVRHRVAWVANASIATDDDARKTLVAALAKSGAGFLELVSDGATPDALVGLDAKGRYQIFEGAIVGGARVPLAGVPASLAVTEDGAKELVTRLLRLARYRTLIALTQTQSPLNSTVRVELHAGRFGDTEEDPSVEGPALSPVNGRYEVRDGDVLFIHVTNLGTQTVNLAAFDFSSRWGIELLAPAPAEGAEFAEVGAREEKSFPLQVSVPEGFDSVDDVFKVFVTLGPANFPRMCQPRMGDAFVRSAMRGPAKSALDRAFDILDEKENKRDGAALSTPGADWTTKRLDLRVSRAPARRAPLASLESAVNSAETTANALAEPRADVQPAEELTSERIPRDELSALLRAQADGGTALIEAMFPPGAKTAHILAEARGPDVPLAQRGALEALSFSRGAWPFVGTNLVDEAQLAAFNAQFQPKLAAPISAADAHSVKFQTSEDWESYVTRGAASFVSGLAVQRPLKLALHDPPNDMTHPLRAGQSPKTAPLRMGIFADFGNGLYASRENARRIIEREYPYVFHLGDVYYDGNAQQFKDYFADPLAPLLAKSELFMLSGNHEMYSKGVNFQKYVMEKSARPDGKQRQVAEMFRLKGNGLQIIGIDTMWCGWEGKLFRGNEPRLDAATRSLLERWLADSDPDGLTILMTSNEPWSTESSKTTGMLDDFEPYIRRGLIDVWFWGNVHHAALYDSWQFDGAVEHGFVGACVGHGGYPFYVQGAPKPPKGVTCRWSERKHRFWPYANVRPDVGLNGWSELAVSHDANGWSAALTFRDWVGRDRARSVITKAPGMGPRLASVQQNTSPDPNVAEWDATDEDKERSR